MNLNSPVLLDCGPALFEFLLHFFPYLERLFTKFLDLEHRRFFELEQTIASLQDSRHTHQMFKLSEGVVGFVTTPRCLNLNGGKDRAIRAFKHQQGVGHGINDGLDVDDA